MEWVEAPAEDGEGLAEEVRRAANRRARQTYYKRVDKDMAAVVAATRHGGTDVACAILEMSEELERKPRQDPYTLSKRALARGGILVQPFLVPVKKPCSRACVRP